MLILSRVSDADPALLRYCAGLRLLPGTELTVTESRPFAAGTTARFTGHEAGIEIGPDAANAIWVSPRPRPAARSRFRTGR
ncbi:FeoA family protein [Pseudarthrobacter sp. R1]|uniref:FeoA family protein n=1 Tax=Pseudarthrobacter sp. R1 TaxID=2944934 RepID=UPI0027E33134|nr:FeoA family protein [Pseudarthrobacter sp. R1]